MATEKIPAEWVDCLTAGADLSAKLHYLVKINSDGTAVLAAAATDMALGPIVEAAASGAPVTYQFGGIGKVVAGGAINPGDKLTSDGNGKAVATTTAGNRVFGVARTAAAADGEIVSFVFARGHNATS